MTLEELYDLKKIESTDIGEHMNTLMWYASQVQHVTEFGVRGGCSTAALLAGRPRSLTCYDINDFPERILYSQVAQDNDIFFLFDRRDDCARVIAPTDLLFIDTVHIYAQLRKELAIHANQVRRFIICHDTYSVPDPVNGAPENDGVGMRRAIFEFLAAHSGWFIQEEYPNQHGLTILMRRE